MLTFMAGATITGAVVARYKRGEEIVGDAARQLGHDIGGGRRDHQRVDALRDGDMLDGAFDVGGARHHPPKTGR